MTATIPICLYPMRKIILDDDQAFIQSILLKMHGNHFLSYNSPKKAIQYLLEEYKPALTKSDLTSLDTTVANPSIQHTINIQIEKIKQILNYSNHQDISVLFVDYHMPEMYGLDFLKEINHLPIKKALVTGEKDYKIGIDAFNNGLVDTYIRKDDPDFVEKIQNIASELEWKYFSELSSLVADIANFSYLRNNNLIAKFKQYIKENNILSFCLIDTDGNFIMQDKNSTQSYFLVRSKNQLQSMAEIAKEDNGSVETINNLKHGNVIPFFGYNKYWEIPANEWDQNLYPTNPLPGDDELVWAIVGAKAAETYSIHL